MTRELDLKLNDKTNMYIEMPMSNEDKKTKCGLVLREYRPC